MGKISPISIKYNIIAEFVCDGVVEKPDIIGAVFGQTEGLLGEELDLRELQKKGKIGRIDVDMNTEESKTVGKIEIPASLDKTETTLIAAAIETVERVGPCNAKIRILSIEDVRGSKREYIVTRAKKLLEGLGNIDIKEMESTVTAGSREARIKEYGKEMLPAGEIEDCEEVIVVEGRADVLNLLRCGIKNVIAMNGTSLPKTIKELGEEKKLVIFADGDRGGKLIAKDAVMNSKIDSIAIAPPGKEVEELSEKEIMMSLRNRMSVKEFMSMFKTKERE